MDDEWTIGTLVSCSVISASGRQLVGIRPRCEFFSALSPAHLAQLGDDARTAESLGEFEASRERRGSPGRRLVGPYPRACLGRLRRVYAGNEDEDILCQDLCGPARALVDAPPDDVIAHLGDFLDEHLAAEADGTRRVELSTRNLLFPANRLDPRPERSRQGPRGGARYRDGIAADRAAMTEISRSADGIIAGLLASRRRPGSGNRDRGRGASRPALIGHHHSRQTPPGDRRHEQGACPDGQGLSADVLGPGARR